MCVCSACHMCVQMPTPMWKPGEDIDVLLCYFLIPFTMDLSVNLELGCQPANPSDPLVSVRAHTVLGFYVCAGDSNSSLHSCTANAVTYEPSP